MSTTTALRRGKPVAKAEPTLLIEEGTAATVRRATVRRKFCGTGHFDRHWLNLDCCGLFCACFTYLLHAYGVYVVCFLIVPPWMSVTGEEGGVRTLTVVGMFHQTAFMAVSVMAVISHFMAMTTDPGAVPPDAKPLPDAPETTTSSEQTDEGQDLLARPKVKKLCRRCRAFKPQRAHHCSICRRCIIKMDHHCPWVNNCVGIGNHKYFLLFVFYTFLTCIYSLLLVIARFTNCMGESHHSRHGHHHRHVSMTCLDKPTQLLNVLGLLIESLLFGMFTSCMIFDQSDVIFSKLTHIDRLKGVDIGGALAGITEVFGVGRRGVGSTRFQPNWLSPFSKVCFPPSVRDEVMGFCRPAAKPPTTEMTQPTAVRPEVV